MGGPSSRAAPRCARTGPHAGEWPRDHTADRMLAGQRLAHLTADLIERVGLQDIYVGGDLEHRILTRVDDQVAAADVRSAEVLDRLDPVVWPVAEDPAAAGGAHRLDHVHRESIRVGGHPRGCEHAHQLPVPRAGVLARPERMQPAMQDRGGRARHALQLQDRPEPETLERREAQAAGLTRQMTQCVRAGVAVVRGVRKRADTTGVEDDHEGAAHSAATRNSWIATPTSTLRFCQPGRRAALSKARSGRFREARSGRPPEARSGRAFRKRHSQSSPSQ